VDWVDRDYFREVVQLLLDDPLVQYIREIGEGKKDAFLGQAYALLFPSGATLNHILQRLSPAHPGG
jgi:hypothetical protein